MKVLYSKVGKVFLVGAGPGDPELLTIKGMRALRSADVVVYDRLSDVRLLDYAPARAQRIPVGKKGGHYGFPQEKINQLLVLKARQGLKVVRLKGGDPFLFGRGGEEALFLQEHGIPFEVIPGVSSCLAVPAAAGIPVTHRGVASSVAIVTGHSAADASSDVAWEKLADASDTLVVLMPLKNLRQIVSRLVLHGRSLDTPAALIESGTLKEQRQVTGTLKTITAQADSARVASPALLVVGEVVRLTEQLNRLAASVSGDPDRQGESLTQPLSKLRGL